MTRDLYHCTRCNVVLAVSARRKLPNACPACNAKDRGRNARRLFERVEQ